MGVALNDAEYQEKVNQTANATVELRKASSAAELVSESGEDAIKETGIVFNRDMRTFLFPIVERDLGILRKHPN